MFELWPLFAAPLQPKSSIFADMPQDYITTPEEGQWWPKSWAELISNVSYSKTSCYLTWLRTTSMHELEGSFLCTRPRYRFVRKPECLLECLTWYMGLVRLTAGSLSRQRCGLKMPPLVVSIATLLSTWICTIRTDPFTRTGHDQMWYRR